MPANNCPACYTPYDHCTCTPTAPARLAGSNNASTQARGHFRAWRTLRQVAKSVTLPTEHVEGTRHIDTGRVTTDRGKPGPRPDLYVG